MSSLSLVNVWDVSKTDCQVCVLPVSAVGTVSVVSIIPPLDYTSRQIVQLYEKTCHTQWHCFQAQLDTN